MIRLWDLPTRQEKARLVGHTGSVAALAFNSKTGVLLSGSFDTTVRTWHFSGHKEELSQR